MIPTVDLIFLTGLSFLVIGHELDAIQNHEWRFFFAKIPISDQAAYQIFTALHVPLAVWIIWAWQNPSFQFWFDIFLIAHGLVHWLLRNHPKVKFNNNFSRLWIFGGAFLGLIHLWLVFL